MAANLTPGSGSAMAGYTDAAAFVRTMETGQRSDGSRIAVMPIEALSKMNDNDLLGLYAYLKMLPARPVGSR